MGWNRKAEEFFDTIVEIFRPVPPIAWIPIIMIVIGSGLLGQGTIVFIGAFFPILLNTISGVKSLPIVFVEAARTFGASERQILLKVAIPNAIPAIMTGVRIGLGVGWMCIVAAEMVGVKKDIGLGREMMYMLELGHYWGIIASMAMLGITAYLMNWLLVKMEEKLIVWR
jgi:NitT/TauT family transport system permease protein